MTTRKNDLGAKVEFSLDRISRLDVSQNCQNDMKLRTLQKSYTKSPQGLKNVKTSSRLLSLLR